MSTRTRDTRDHYLFGCFNGRPGYQGSRAPSPQHGPRIPPAVISSRRQRRARGFSTPGWAVQAQPGNCQFGDVSPRQSGAVSCASSRELSRLCPRGEPAGRRHLSPPAAPLRRGRRQLSCPRAGTAACTARGCPSPARQPLPPAAQLLLPRQSPLPHARTPV